MEENRENEKKPKIILAAIIGVITVVLAIGSICVLGSRPEEKTADKQINSFFEK